MEITDIVTITELSRLTQKSRPTIYKWLTLYGSGRKGELPKTVSGLFDLISKNGTKSEIYRYCENAFSNDVGEDELAELFELIKNNRDKLELDKIKNYILGEINNG